MAHSTKKSRTLQEHWSGVHLTIFYSSLFFATVIFLIFLFFSGPTPAMPLESKILIHAGTYFAFLILGGLVHYLFFYLPNYISYKRMMKDGREKEIQSMIDEHGLEKLISRDWFTLNKRMKQEKHPKPKSNDVDKEK